MRYSKYSVNEQVTIPDMLEMRTVDQLKKLAARIEDVTSVMNKSGVLRPESRGKLPTRKADIMDWIASYLRSEDFLKALYDKCSDIERHTLEEAVHVLNGRIDRFRIQAKYGKAGDTAIPWERKKEAPILALCFTNNHIMPEELWKLMGQVLKEPEEIRIQAQETFFKEINPFEDSEADPIPVVQHQTELAAIQDLTIFLHLIDTGKISVGKTTGIISKASAKTVMDSLSHGDFYSEDAQADYAPRDPVEIGALGIRPFAWCQLVQAGNLAKINGTKLALTKAGRTALKKPPHEIIKVLWLKWLKNRDFHEMSRIELLKGQKSRKRPLAPAPLCRHEIAKAMEELEAGKWSSTETFFKHIVATGHNFTAVRDPWALYLFDREYGSMGYSNVVWDHIEGRFARAFLLEYAATLGLIDVACIPPWEFWRVGCLGDLWGLDDCTCMSRYDGLWGMRMNALGAWVLGKIDEYKPSRKRIKVLRALPNLEIALLNAPQTCPEAVFLDRFCKKISEDVWSISMPSLLEAVESGLDINQITGFLEGNCDGPLPLTMESLLQEAFERIGKVKDIGEARIIECKDASLIRLIVSDSRLAKMCMNAGKRTLVVPSANIARFRKALRDLGYVLDR
ncbi:conserved hypothetical protein [Desulfatibacillum aliphaticivorans]|uniref:Helicase XPB/Ssl2 N-terminal domain-containing protein n=1 Tax=Desulfatibacillum aliphaticivorans TaxID=218208 RepID=B8FL24_DESAL|nr:helicase-associated domain-containing protein [Desulfatibacillum aliphaticivorans]ACL04659.1 conserved hypothetical protein [Desulfatibacillum aliphaticivorans]